MTDNENIKDKETAPETAEGAAEASEKETGEKDNKKEKKSEKKKANAELEKLKKELENVRGELAENKDKYLRLAAEYDNFRRRAAKEKEGVYSDAYADVISAILPVIDNLERAVKFSEDKESKLYEGLSMTLRSFEETLEKLGVEVIESDGKEFDPNLHNAVMHIEDDSYGENVVVETFTKGYRKGDKIIRYAMVKVAN